MATPRGWGRYRTQGPSPEQTRRGARPRAPLPLPGIVRARPHRSRGSIWALLALVGALALLPATPASSAQTHAAAPISIRFATPETYLNGTLAWGTNQSDLSGVSIQVYNSTMASLGSSVTSSQRGSWSFLVPQFALYFVVAASSGALGEGGGWAQFAVANVPSNGNLLQIWPLVPYDNASFVLPDYANLSLLSDSPGGLQQPMLSWESDSVLYVGTVNGSLDLLDYSLANQSLRTVAPWVPLVENLMAYTGWLNNAFLTEDGSWVYEFGCPRSCTSTGPFLSYAVNVSTGATFQHNWTGLGSIPHDPQVQIDMVGLSGNLSTEMVLVGGDPSRSATAHAYDVWNRTEWIAGTMPFFEANNVYWVPQLQSYFDVEAGGYSNDSVAQVELGGLGDGTSVSTVYSGGWGPGYRINFVQGVYFNVTSRTLSATAGFNNNGGGAQLATFTYGVQPNGTISKLDHLWKRSYSCKACGQEIPTVESDEHRPMTVADGPALAAEYTDLFGVNNSWLVNPMTGAGFLSTNQSLFGDNPLVTTSGDMNQGGYDVRPDSALDGQFVNATRMIAPSTLDCAATSGKVPCPIKGTASGTTVGTVYYLWQASASEFAFPATQGPAQTTAPGPVQPTLKTNASEVGATWSLPTNDDPALNYTVYWNSTNGSTQVASGAVSLPPTAGNLSITSSYGDRTCLTIVAWNLHWQGAPATVCGSVTLAAPSAPTGLRLEGATLSSATLSWSKPPQLVSNYTLYYGPSCPSLQSKVTGVNATSYTLLGLSPGTSYCARVVAVNPVGVSPLGPPLNFSTSSPNPGNGFVYPGWGSPLPGGSVGNLFGSLPVLGGGGTMGNGGNPCPNPPCGQGGLGGSGPSGGTGGRLPIDIHGFVLTPLPPAKNSGALHFTVPALAAILAGIAIAFSGRLARWESVRLGWGVTASGAAIALATVAVVVLF